jgi:hypothetical protein
VVSQRSMRRIFGSPAFLLGPAIVLLAVSGCGASEGSRCQINSDCASGLVCSEGTTGNGICKPSNGVAPTDAAAKLDANLSTGPEVEPAVDVQSAVEVETAVDTGAVDGAAASEVGPAVLPDATANVDADADSTL